MYFENGSEKRKPKMSMMKFIKVKGTWEERNKIIIWECEKIKRKGGKKFKTEQKVFLKLIVLEIIK